jgi:succinate dehydrogenase hydrophobic anchor subunit
MQNSGASMLTAVVTAVVVFLLTTAWFTMKAARNTARAAKAAVGPARKLFWSTIGGFVKTAFWAALLLFALVTWLVHDVRGADDATPAPSPSVSRR